MVHSMDLLDKLPEEGDVTLERDRVEVVVNHPRQDANSFQVAMESNLHGCHELSQLADSISVFRILLTRSMTSCLLASNDTWCRNDMFVQFRSATRWKNQLSVSRLLKSVILSFQIVVGVNRNHPTNTKEVPKVNIRGACLHRRGAGLA